MDLEAPFSPSAPMAHQGLRERMLARFSELLERALAEEPQPRIPAQVLAILEGEGTQGEDTDLRALWSAMTVLAQEVKLQGRTFKQLTETVAPLAQLESSVQETLSELRRSAEAHKKAASEQAWRPVIDLLLDLRDRLVRGLDGARAHTERAQARPQGFWARLRGRRAQPLAEAGQALVEGYRLTLDRLEDALAEFGIAPITCSNQPFDAHRMKAVELCETDEVAEGTVLGVIRPGYERHGELLREAEVKVARSPLRPGEKI
jgi:molecular chaperone GrpE